MDTLTTTQLDDLYRSFKREVPLRGFGHTMTITDYYHQVWRKQKAKEGNREKRPRLQEQPHDSTSSYRSDESTEAVT
jgi:ribosomal protein S21